MDATKIRQAIEHLEEAKSELASLLPPPTPGLPPGVMEVGPGTIIKIEQPFLPMAGQAWIHFHTDSGEEWIFKFFTLNPLLFPGQHYTSLRVKENEPDALDQLYGATPDPAPIG